jgi:hypothetical protein
VPTSSSAGGPGTRRQSWRPSAGAMPVEALGAWSTWPLLSVLITAGDCVQSRPLPIVSTQFRFTHHESRAIASSEPLKPPRWGYSSHKTRVLLHQSVTCTSCTSKQASQPAVDLHCSVKRFPAVFLNMHAIIESHKPATHSPAAQRGMSQRVAAQGPASSAQSSGKPCLQG